MENSLTFINQFGSQQQIYPDTELIIQYISDIKEICIESAQELNNAHIINSSPELQSIKIINCSISSFNSLTLLKSINIQNNNCKLLIIFPVKQDKLEEVQLISGCIQILDFNQMPNIRALNLSFNPNFSSQLPSNLTSLIITDCDLKFIHLKKMTNLQNLDISNNQNIKIYKDYIPKSLNNLKAVNCGLQHLNLLSCEHLEFIDISSNLLQFLITDTSSCYIILTNNPLEFIPYAPNCCLDFEANELQEEIKQNKIQKYIESNTKFRDFKDYLADLSQGISKDDNEKQLHASVDQVCVEDGKLQLNDILNENIDTQQNQILIQDPIDLKETVLYQNDHIFINIDQIFLDKQKIQFFDCEQLKNQNIVINTSSILQYEFLDCGIKKLLNNHHHVESVNIQNQDTQFIFDQQFAVNFQQLDCLELFQCDLDLVNLKQFSQLKLLNLGANHRLQIQDNYLPRSLTSLNLDDCNLRTLNLISMKLENLSISRNSELEIQSDFLPKTLITLNATQCNLKHINLSGMDKLLQCDISFNDIQFIIIDKGKAKINLQNCNKLKFQPFAPFSECIYSGESFLELPENFIKTYIKTNGRKYQIDSQIPSKEISSLDLAIYHRTQAQSLMLALNFEQALQSFNKSIEIQTSLLSISGRAECNYSLHFIDQSLEDSIYVYKNDKKDIQNLHRIVSIYQQQNQIENAITYQELVYEIEPTSNNRENLFKLQKIKQFKTDFLGQLSDEKNNRFTLKKQYTDNLIQLNFTTCTTKEQSENFDKQSCNKYNQILIDKGIYEVPDLLVQQVKFAQENNLFNDEIKQQLTKFHHLSQSENETAEIFQKAMKMRQKSLISIKENKLDESVLYQYESLNLFILLKQECQIGISYCNLAELYKRKHEYNNFIKYIICGFIYDQNNQKICSKAGNFFFDMKNYQMAEFWYLKIIKISKDDEVMKSLQKVQKLITKTVDWFGIIGIPKNTRFTAEELKKTSKKELSKWHPDRSKDIIEKEYFSWRFQLIQQAEEKLSKTVVNIK
ncbi:DnaJ domain-containing protein [Spironucleus salmonicida]|uniref:DnaJ domain-containing protein n=1 Tax=Spironucleus salmonicida TaxID=348837 RepID=V6LS40_9EUKA|nr:DnaJ domain-containing protein [Spironucleus salmonicida]|eukprot:EST47477.1 DnaJ domain-containing protein [Spironucleus salmonicida]